MSLIFCVGETKKKPKKTCHQTNDMKIRWLNSLPSSRLFVYMFFLFKIFKNSVSQKRKTRFLLLRFTLSNLLSFCHPFTWKKERWLKKFLLPRDTMFTFSFTSASQLFY